MKAKGLVVGKFYPPHKGHHYLIDTALAESDEVDVLVCDHPSYSIPAESRAKWLQARHPAAEVSIIKDIEKDADSIAWAIHTEKFLGYTPDIVFSSEDYGDTYAAAMGAVHKKVDKERKKVPISGTQVRADVLKSWNYLEPHVRANFAIRVCILGAESTGTTTLTKALAKYYNAPWVPEYGRIFSESLPDPFTYKWQSDDFVHIAQIQQTIEQYVAGISDGIVFCDTNAFATRLWHERYMGVMSQEVEAVAAHDKVDLYVITAPDIPFEQDGVRDGEQIRLKMNERFVVEVGSTGVPYMIVEGSRESRLREVCKITNKLLKRKVIL